MAGSLTEGREVRALRKIHKIHGWAARGMK
jgi:hypothetical protein